MHIPTLSRLTVLLVVAISLPTLACAQDSGAQEPETNSQSQTSDISDSQADTAAGSTAPETSGDETDGDKAEGESGGTTQAEATTDSETTAAAVPSVPAWRPILAMSLGVFVVLALMIGLKTHAFIALILGALTISCLVPFDIVGFQKMPEPHVVRADDGGSPVQIISRVTSSLGGSVVGIGVLIAMAAIIGKCMLVSGAADRIVQSSLSLLGEKRAALAMMVSGFILSIPVFFDTVFYLLVPLARSLYRKTGKNYLLYLAAIAAGGAITHTLVPPTPGPLLVADALAVNIGTVMFVGLIVGARRHWLG